MAHVCQSVLYSAAYVAGESHFTVLPRNWGTGTATRRCVIVCRGGLTGTIFDHQKSAYKWADMGYPVLLADLGGSASALWGNATNTTRVGQLWTWAKANLGCATDKFIGYAASRGTPDILNYLQANPTQVAAVALENPAVNVDDIHDNNRASAQASINAAHGGNDAAWETAKTTMDPYLNMAAIAATGVPIRMWTSTDDPICLPASATTFASTTGATEVSIGAAGHSVVGMREAEPPSWAMQYATA